MKYCMSVWLKWKIICHEIWSREGEKKVQTPAERTHGWICFHCAEFLLSQCINWVLGRDVCVCVYVCIMCKAGCVKSERRRGVCDKFGSENLNPFGSLSSLRVDVTRAGESPLCFLHSLKKKLERRLLFLATAQITWEKLVRFRSSQSRCIYVPFRSDNLKPAYQTWTSHWGYTLISSANTGSPFWFVGDGCRETVIPHHTYN